MKLRINDIRNFAASSACTTISQAAKKLEISQPALSESLHRLEADLGYELFYRSRSGIQLTSSGRVFLGRAQALLQAYQDLEIDTSSGNMFGGRSITIGCHPTVAQYSIPKALAYLQSHAPDFNVELKHDLSRNIQSEIQRGRIDIGIVINPVEVPDLVIQRLAFDTVGIWGNRGKKDADTIICNPNLFQTHAILKRWKNKPTKIITTDCIELICHLVHEGIGLGVIPERAVKLSGFKLTENKTLPSFKDEISLVYRPEFGKLPAERITVAALKNAVLS